MKQNLEQPLPVGDSMDNWYNVEDNADLDTSNESYMSSSDEEADTLNNEHGERFTLNVHKEPTRQEKMLLERRFDAYF